LTEASHREQALRLTRSRSGIGFTAMVKELGHPSAGSASSSGARRAPD
jgi:hypothetical protein